MKPTVLVIEDDNDLGEVLKSALEFEGYEVLVARTAETGVDLLLTHPVSIILLDKRLPGIGGDGFLRIKEQHGDLINMPVIVMTGETPPPPKESLPDHPSWVISKPFDLKTLFTLVEQYRKK